MSLTLTILHGPKLDRTNQNGPDGIGLATRRVARGAFSIGRVATNDWMLPDPERHLSKRHCVITFRDGFWEVTDLSTNGTFLNRDPAPIGNQAVRDLRDGDRLKLGGYEIAIAIADDPPAIRRSDASSDPLSPSLPPPSSPMLDPLSLSLLAPPSPPSGLDAPRHGVEAPGQGAMIDPPSVHGANSSSSASDAGFFDQPVQSDHTPGIEDAFSPPRPVVLLGEDWDLGNSHASGPEQARNLPPDLSQTPSPVVAAEPEPPDLMAAFLRGAGMAGARPADPTAAMEALGAAFRALVGGLRETLITRAAVKSEFRIPQTLIRAHGNNPLKFSASDDDALLALLGAGRRTDIGPAEAVSEAFRDIGLHELATMAAMQAAARDLLQALAPSKLREQADQGGGLNLLLSQRKVRAWDAFELAHGRLTQALSDSFDSAFGRSFARAYEQASREVGRGQT
jgi:type VI secretion system protein ImpI/type VI secretion system protein